MSAANKTISLIISGMLFCHSYGQDLQHEIQKKSIQNPVRIPYKDVLKEAEKKFLIKDSAIASMAGKSIISNESKLYKRISAHHTVDFDKKIDSSTCVIKTTKDYYKYRFKDSLIFNNTTFRSDDTTVKVDIDFSLVKCLSYVSFHQSVIDGKATFPWAQFDGDVVFSRVKFIGDASFQHTVFSGYCDFFQSNFYAGADFYGSQFNETSNFGNINFRSETNFSFTEINNNCIFRNTELGASCLFNNARINGTLDFTGAKFDSLANFSFCSVNGSIIFNNATLPAYLDFSGIQSTNSIIDLTQIKANEKYQHCKINLVNADVSKIKLPYENFQLWFPENTSYETKCKVYEELLASLHSFGFISGYEKLDIEYKRLRYYYNHEYLKNKIQKLWWNYGYDKEKIFIWSFWIVFILTLINSLLIRQLMGSIYEMKYLNYSKITERHKLHPPLINFFLNIPTGFLYTVILLAGGAFGIKFNSDQIRFPNFMGMLYIISIGLLGIGCSAFMLKFIFNL